MSDDQPVDGPTRRLGTVAAVVYSVTSAMLLARMVLGDGWGPEAVSAGLAVVLAAAGFGLRGGRTWARTVLVAFLGLTLVVVVLALTRSSYLTELLACAAAALIAFVWLVAVSFSIERREPALPFPEGWREWATDRRTHILLLVVGLLSALLPY